MRVILTLAVLLLASRTWADDSAVRWTWSGGTTDQCAVVTAGVIPSGRILLELQNGPEKRRIAPTLERPLNSGRLLRFDINGLQPSTLYKYRLLGDSDKALDAEERSFRTLPVPGTPTSFRFAFGACARPVDSPAFRAAGNQKIDFFLHTGDFHYADISENRVERFRAAFDAHLSAPSLRDLLHKTPLIYQWDDHDFGPDNSNRTSPSRDASRRNYSELVPHYPFAIPDSGTTDQAFTVGRVRFLISDLRSERDPKARRMMNAAQDRWLRAELLAAKGRHPLIFWVSSVPWNGAPSNDDRWQGYPAHRREMADFIRENNITGVCILAGDAHMTAIDDGENADFSTTGDSPRIRIFQAGPLANRGSYKGGPYSHGGRAEGQTAVLHQFGLVEIHDDGGSIRVKWSGRQGADGVGNEVLRATRWGTAPIELEFEIP